MALGCGLSCDQKIIFSVGTNCPLNSVTEGASLKSLQSHGGDEVTAAGKWEYLRIMSERYR